MYNFSNLCPMTSLNMKTSRTLNPRKEKAINKRIRNTLKGIKKEEVVIKAKAEVEVNIVVKVETEIRAEVKANDKVETEDDLETSQ